MGKPPSFFFFFPEPLTLSRAHVAGLVWDWTLINVKRPSWVSELSDVSANTASANSNLPAQHLQHQPTSQAVCLEEGWNKSQLVPEVKLQLSNDILFKCKV